MAPTACHPTTVGPGGSCEQLAMIEPSTCNEALHPKDKATVGPVLQRQASYSEFSKSCKRLGMLTVGEAQTSSTISISSWTSPKPTAGEGLVFGSAYVSRNLLVKARWPNFGEPLPSPPLHPPQRLPALPPFCTFIS